MTDVSLVQIHIFLLLCTFKLTNSGQKSNSYHLFVIVKGAVMMIINPYPHNIARITKFYPRYPSFKKKN